MGTKKCFNLSISFFLLLLGWLAGCSQGRSDTTGPAAKVVPLSIECQVFYRSSVTVGIEREEMVPLTGNSNDQRLVFEDLEFQASFSTGEEPPYERGLLVRVRAAGSQEELLVQLYQMSRTEPIHNQFVGDHGFTGLNYVYHPTSRAEMQYLCIAR